MVSWRDEGFSKNYTSEVRKRVLATLNPGFLKPPPAIPETLHDREIHEVYGGLGYLIVARKNQQVGCTGVTLAGYLIPSGADERTTVALFKQEHFPGLDESPRL
jgi:hypothetical protein